MSKTRVGLVQINNSFSGQNYFPLSVGMLQAYAQKNLTRPKDYEFLTPIYTRIPVDQAVEQLTEADIVGFSTYVWNFEISKAIAKKLKQRKPEITIAFGGPHVPDRLERLMANVLPVFGSDGKLSNQKEVIFYDTSRTEQYLRDNTFVDIACHGEGEQIFLDLLEDFQGDWQKIPSISFLNAQSRFIQTERLSRINNLDILPSPYLEKIFEPIIRANPNEQWIGMWETNRGCPFSCSFCDWGSAVAAKVNRWDIDRIKREIEWFAEHQIVYVFCADANFGILQRDLEIAAYLAEMKGKFGYPKYISIQATKNAQERSYRVQKILANADMNRAVVLSMQSLHKPTLEAIKRDNISLTSFQNLQTRFAKEGVETLTDLILGQPEETYESWKNGIDTLLKLGQHNRIQFNNFSLLPNAEAGDPDYQKRYGLEVVTSKIVNVHGSLPANNEIVEYQQLVVATKTCNRRDWVRTRAFSWMAAFLHFDKIMQILVIILRRTTNLSYKKILEFFAEGQFARYGEYPVLQEICDCFTAKAQDIQNGGVEYCHASEWLNMYWPADEYIFIKLCRENKLSNFYAEALDAINAWLNDLNISLDPQIILEAISLNHRLIKLPFNTGVKTINLKYNIWEVYRSVVLNDPIPLQATNPRYCVDYNKDQWHSWEDWYREVVWFSNRKGAYLHGSISSNFELEGHF